MDDKDCDMASPFEIHYALSELADHERFTPGPLAQAFTFRAFGAEHSSRADNRTICLRKYKLISRFQRLQIMIGYYLGRWPRLLHHALSALVSPKHCSTSGALPQASSFRAFSALVKSRPNNWLAHRMFPFVLCNSFGVQIFSES